MKWLSKSRSQSTTLPVHSERTTGIQKRVNFEETEHPSLSQRILRVFIKVKHSLLSASTGSISDGFTDALSGATDSEGSAAPAFTTMERKNGEDEDWKVDEVVVNGEESMHRGPGLLDSEKDTTTRQSPSDSGSTRYGQGIEHETRSSSFETGPYAYIRWKIWPLIRDFFEPRFDDAEQEKEFQKVVWYSTKRLTFYASLYLILNWVLYLILNPNVSLYEKIAYYGGLSLVTFPVPLMIAADMPRKHPILFQLAFCIAAWYCGVTELIEMKQCHFFSHRKLCGKKDFLAMNYYITALPMLAMFIVTKRLYNFIFQVSVFILLIGLLIPDQGIYWRNVIGFGIFSLFMQFLHYSKEMSERRMFLLSHQLKAAYRRQQKAQMAESKASNAKRRFASYIFHEVRVPLNTAMLAYQNLEPVFKSVVERNSGEQAIEVDAMQSSLHMMQTVLNDALDLDRMDAGRFESSPRPFPLHRTIQYILRHTAVATAQRQLHLSIDLDNKIDQIPCEPSHNELWVIGDDVRLRQVISNLASNAVKFSPQGGEVKVSTRLLSPAVKMQSEGLNARDFADKDEQSPLLQASGSGMLLFRLEVHDQGPGIKPSDLATTRLFQPFAQTEVGKANGKGSGLGLAIVRQIVSLSGGRLGIQSQKGQGATFWVEMVYPIATAAALHNAQKDSGNHSPPLASALLSRSPMPSETSGITISPVVIASPHSPLPSDEVDIAARSFATSIKPPSLAVRMSSSHIPLLSQDLLSAFPLQTPPLIRDESYSTQSSSVLTSGTSYGAASECSQAKSEETAKASPTDPPPPPDEPLQILVVDDDSLTRTLMTRMLTKLGCVVDVAVDGQQCLDMVVGPTPSGSTPKTYDVISLDNHMPVMTGMQAVEKMRSMGRKDYVVGCTGNALSEDQASYRAAGADLILTKPIMHNQLKAVLQTAKERRQCKAHSDDIRTMHETTTSSTAYPPKPKPPAGL